MTTPETYSEIQAQEPPQHIKTSFHAPYAEPQLLYQSAGSHYPGAWFGGWKCDNSVLTAEQDHARADWSAKTRDALDIAGVNVAKPLRSTDGRFVVSGWTSKLYSEGFPAPLFDSLALAVLRVNQALAKEKKPSFIRLPQSDVWSEQELFLFAEDTAFSDNPIENVQNALDPTDRVRPDVANALAAIQELQRFLQPIEQESQVVVQDGLTSFIFDNSQEPVLTHLPVTYRPQAWTVAVLSVDALAWGQVDDGFLERWEYLSDYTQLLLRALIYRLALHAIHPQADENAWPGLARVVELVKIRLI